MKMNHNRVIMQIAFRVSLSGKLNRYGEKREKVEQYAERIENTINDDDILRKNKK